MKEAEVVSGKFANWSRKSLCKFSGERVGSRFQNFYFLICVRESEVGLNFNFGVGVGSRLRDFYAREVYKWNTGNLFMVIRT